MSPHVSIAHRGARPRRRSRLAEQRGSSLFLLLILAVVMATVLGGVFSYISVNARSEKRSNVRMESTYAAEYAFERAYQQLSSVIGQNGVNLPNVSQTTAATNLTTAPSDVFTSSDGYTWKSFITVPVESGAPTGTLTASSTGQGDYKYMTIVEFQRTVPGMTAPVHMQFQREWNYDITPLFQYAIFYNSDLELFPGATFNVSGRVHSNGKIYTGTTASITFSDYVTDVNGVSNSYSPLDPRSQPALNGPITYSKAQPIATTQKNPPGQLGSDTSDANYNNDGSHELVELPNSWQSDANASERMYNKAGLKILVNSTASTVTDDAGVSLSGNSKMFLTEDGTQIPSTDALATYLATLVSTGSFKDYREGSSFTTTDVDVSRINTAYNAGGLPQTIPTTSTWPNNSSVPAALKNQPISSALRGKDLWNGVLYVADVTNSSTHRTGVKVVNGASLPDGTSSSSPIAGLTLATPNAAFVVGDYNTGGTPPVGSGSSLTANNYAAGYTVQPAAIIADAVTVVSSNWTSGSYDTKPTLSTRPAVNTTVNSAIISGTVPSDGSAYSGGVENFIRLLEDWSGKRLTYYGSMVNVYASQQSTAHWQNTGVYYNAPARNWYFDINFLDPNKLPPGTPLLRTLSKGQWMQIE
jgi:hypothetical protein